MAIPHLLRLPVELHLSIIDKLELHNRVNLAFTNRYFRSIVKPPSHSDYLGAEAGDWAKNRGLFACSDCACFRRFEEFADDMKKGKRTRGGIEAVARLCLRCGAACGLYVPGTPVVIYGKPHVLCQLCGTFTDRAACQATCSRCSPGSHQLLPSSTGSNDHHYVPERTLSRSTRAYFDRTTPDDLYGVWPDS
jgi:hypothetical protein